MHLVPVSFKNVERSLYSTKSIKHVSHNILIAVIQLIYEAVLDNKDYIFVCQHA